MLQGVKMTKNEYQKYYNSIKEYKGKKYSGMRVGGKHSWDYKLGIWDEIKVLPDKWKFEFKCNKYRRNLAPAGTGAPNKTAFHWYILADQKVIKIDENTYETMMAGLKFKVGHRRPNFKYWNYEYNKELYEDRIIKILESIIENLKAKKKRKELASFFKISP